MRPERLLEHEFVEFIPDQLKDDTIYVSIPYATVVHKCCCGCGTEVVTPLSPTDWTLKFDGESISLDPSIGNWSFDCKSHYWISQSRVHWAEQWSESRIKLARFHEGGAEELYFHASHSAEKREGEKGLRQLWRRTREWKW
jgi:hypothetical protein